VPGPQKPERHPHGPQPPAPPRHAECHIRSSGRLGRLPERGRRDLSRARPPVRRLSRRYQGEDGRKKVYDRTDTTKAPDVLSR
jgi:hypothetical protein